MIQHTVFFDLKPDLTEAERADFERGLRSLADIPALRRIEIGRPAPLPKRPVSDSAFTYALYTWFASAADHDAYQVHPLHRAFLERHSSRWTRVRVFDTELAEAAPAVTQVRGLHHISLRSAQFDRSVALYRDTLGLREKLQWNMNGRRAVMLDAGNGGIVEIFERDPAPAGEGVLLHFALKVASTDAAAAAARAAGCAITVEPKSVTIQDSEGRGAYPIRIAFFQGPDGESVELFEEVG